MKLFFAGLLAGIFATSCDFIKPKTEGPTSAQSGQKPVARVNDKYLYIEDFKTLIPEGTNAIDSQQIVARFVESWIKKHLLMAAAERNGQIDMAAIDSRIQDYKYDLMGYELRKQEVERNLDYEVSEEEIKNYYENNKKNYELKTNIVRAVFIKVPKQAPHLEKLERSMKETSQKATQYILSFCNSYATSCYLDDTVWYEFDQMVINTPFQSIDNKIQFLKRNGFTKDNDGEFYYFLKIKEYRFREEIAPLDFAKDQIKKIIIGKRKQKIIQAFESKIYNEGKNKGYFEKY